MTEDGIKYKVSLSLLSYFNQETTAIINKLICEI